MNDSIDNHDDNAVQVGNAAALADIADFEQRFGIAQGEQLDVMQCLTELYGWNSHEFDHLAASEVFEGFSQTATELHNWAESRGDPETCARTLRVIQCVQESWSTLHAVCKWSGNEQIQPLMAEDQLLRFAKPPTNKEKPMQAVFKFILAWCGRLQVRHRGDTVYQEIVSGGMRTHAWLPAIAHNGEDIKTVGELCSYICKKSRNPAIWELYVTLSMPALHTQMKLCREPQFSIVKTIRSMIAFKDGLYSIYGECFFYYGDPRFLLDRHVAVCAYHNVDFAPIFLTTPRRRSTDPIPRSLVLHPLHDVPTPMLDQILNTQKLCGHTRFWLLAMLGRLLYWGGVLDDWQVVLYIKGRAGTGKSTLLNVIASIYDLQDVCIISNDTQSTFGLQSLTPQKLLWLAPEVKVDFNMDQAQFQSLVSHEPMAMNRKNMTAFEGIIHAQGGMAGNTLPLKWNENAGSLRRRVVIFNFNEPVRFSRNDLATKLKTEELPALLRKINYCYRHAVALLGAKDFWQSGCLSEHMLVENERMYKDMNPLRHFIAGGSGIQIGPEYWCPESVFLEEYRGWCGMSNRNPGQWCTDFYDVVLSDFNIKVQQARYVWNGAPLVCANVVSGCMMQKHEGQRTVVPGQDNPIMEEEAETITDLFKVPQSVYDL